jgi:hypothetical protein
MNARGGAVMRPDLTKDIQIEDFKNYYWLKEELQQFCKNHGLSATGSKQEITRRVEIFLETGEIVRSARKTKRISQSYKELSLETVITENHRCSQEVRAFFKTIIPNFRFTVEIQNFFKYNPGKTYRDAVEAWYMEEERKKDPTYKKDIPPQFEYNRFIRDFFSDPANDGKTRDDAIDAWKTIKKLPGSNQYKPQN